MEEGAQDGEYEHRAVPHVAVRAPLPVRAPPRPVCSLGHIGRVLARRARSTRCPVSRDVRRAELLKAFSALSDPCAKPVNGGLSPRRAFEGPSLPVGHVVRSADSAMRRWSVVDGLLRNNARGDAILPLFVFVNNVLKLFRA